MRSLSHELGTIHIPGPDDPLDELYRLRDSADYWAADTETTGLNHYQADFRTKIVQVGTKDQAWILRPEWHLQAIVDMVTRRKTSWHLWRFDALALETIGVPIDDLFAQVECTETLFRLIDPRPVDKGGTGHKLEQLSYAHLGTRSKKDAKRALWEAWGRRNKVKIDEIFAKIPVDNDEYNIYAGQDVFLTARLAEVAAREVRRRPNLAKFEAFELPLSRRLLDMQRIGMPFDQAWASRAETEYDEITDEAERELVETWRIDKSAAYAHTSTKALRARFEELGVTWTKFSEKTGNPSLDKEVLAELVTDRGDIGKLAACIFRAKRNKHYGDYIRSMRNELGTDGRVHPNIRPMEAATHRMSVSKPALQQFPRGDNRPRGCLLADEDEVILCADYAQVEFRIGAAISQDPVMVSKILNGEDLHAVTATALFGPNFTSDQRQVAKPIGFGRLYLGGIDGIYQQMAESDTTGCLPTRAATKRAIRAFDQYYKVYNRCALGLKTKVANNNGWLTTATGRELRVSPSYAAANYMVQSTARDVFAAGINRLHKEGFGHMLRLVVHDEVVLSVPRDQAEEIGKLVGECMSTVFRSIPITTEWTIKGERWSK